MGSDPEREVADALADYELGRVLGRGQFGVVYAARHRQLGRDVAVKHLAGDPGEDALARFRREARILAQLDHPHVVTIYDYREVGDVRLLVMETLTGGSLADQLRVGVPIETAVAATMAAATALHHVHGNGVLHRDVKPENLMLSSSGVLKVTDFGVARGEATDQTVADLTEAGSFFGTPAYAAPEQVAEAMAPGWPPVGPATDQWALAAVLYRTLSGEPTHDGTGGLIALFTRRLNDEARPLADVAPEVPPAIADVVMRALARDPAERFGSTEDFAVALGHAAFEALGPDWLDRSSVSIRDPGVVRVAATGTPSITAAGTDPHQRDVLADATTTETGSVVDGSGGGITGATAAVGGPDPIPAGNLTDAASPPGRAVASAADESADRAPHERARPSTRRWPLLAGVAVLAVVLAAVGVVVLRDRGAGQTTSGAPGTTTPGSLPVELAWRFPTDESIRANPLVVDGLVVVGGFDQTLHAVDAATGVGRWELETGGAIRSSAAASGDTVFVGSDDGFLRSVALADGAERWKAQVGFTVAGSPAVADGTVVIGADQLYAYDAATGAERWRFSTGGTDADVIASSPAVADGVVYVGSDNGKVFAVELATGSPRWAYDTGGAVQSSPVVDGRTVYVGTNDDALVALDAATGTLTWRFEAGAPVRSTPAVSASSVFVGTGAGRLVAVDRTTGAEQWSLAAGDKVDGSPALTDPYVLVGSNDGTLYAADQQTGALIARYDTSDPILARPAVAGDLVLVAAYDGTLYALAGIVDGAG